MTSLLSTMIEQDKMDRETSNNPPTPNSREHKEEVSTDSTPRPSDNADSDVHRNGNTSDVALTAPLPFLNPSTVVSQVCLFAFVFSCVCVYFSTHERILVCVWTHEG